MKQKIMSDRGPSKGEKNRSGTNFAISGCKGNTLYWMVVSPENGDEDRISFKVMKDKSVGKDPVVLELSVQNNSCVQSGMLNSDKLYIANPSGAKGDFVVVVSDEPIV